MASVHETGHDQTCALPSKLRSRRTVVLMEIWQQIVEISVESAAGGMHRDTQTMVDDATTWWRSQQDSAMNTSLHKRSSGTMNRKFGRDDFARGRRDGGTSCLCSTP